MLAHMKTHRTEKINYIDVMIKGMPGGKKMVYHIPSSSIQKVDSFLKNLTTEITPWEKAIPWEIMAKDRIEKHKKAGLVLRGARYREDLSQVKLAKLSGIHQNEISKIENGKRGIGEVVAKKLAKPLRINFRLLLDDQDSAPSM